VQHPRLLVLDESTSALDALAERRVLDALAVALRETTLICISHRPAVLRWADRVIELRAGRVVNEDDQVIAEA
jgi:ABC-type bacteriocin/lantibiotic exporter with double-glycine peptidase domain